VKIIEREANEFIQKCNGVLRKYDSEKGDEEEDDWNEDENS